MDASNNQMDMAGRCFITFKISKLNKTYTHEFWVLNTRTYKTLLLGRDFMQKVRPITIDILGNQLKIGNKWLPGEKSESQIRVNSEEEIILPARTETILCVKSKAKSALSDYEFVPKLAGRKGVYLLEALVQPDVHGQFLINALNTNNHSVRINSRTRMGNIISVKRKHKLHITRSSGRILGGHERV